MWLPQKGEPGKIEARHRSGAVGIGFSIGFGIGIGALSQLRSAACSSSALRARLQ
jgi:hypothetical protein